VSAAGLLSDDLKSSAVAWQDRWATPRAEEREQRNSRDAYEALSLQVKRWPTPVVMDSIGAGAAAYSTESGRHAGVTLSDAACRGLLAPVTPQDGPRTSHTSLALNPRFVEALMGWPEGWSACASSGTASSPTKPNSPSDSSLIVSE
jgi:hypothetical protein